MLYFVAISRLPVGIGLLFEFTAPVFIALWVRFGEHQQVKRRLWVGLVLCVVGLVCVTEVWAGELTLNPVGIAAGLVCAVLLAVYYVLGSKSVARRDPLSLTTWAFGISAVAGAIVRPWWNFPYGIFADQRRRRRRSGCSPLYLLDLRHDHPVPAHHRLDAAPAADQRRHHRHDRTGAGQPLRLGAARRDAVAAPDHRRSGAPRRRHPGRDGPHRPRRTGPAPDPRDPADLGPPPGWEPCIQAYRTSSSPSTPPTRTGQIRMLPDAVRTAAAAAEALGVEVGAIANSLIFDADGEPLLVLTSGAHRVDTAKVAAARRRQRRSTGPPPTSSARTPASPSAASPRSATPKPVRTLVDTALAAYDEIWAAGGIPHAVFPTTYDELVRITGGTPAEVA